MIRRYLGKIKQWFIQSPQSIEPEDVYASLYALRGITCRRVVKGEYE